MTKPTYSGRAAAKYLDVDKNTVKNWRKSGFLQPQFDHPGLTLYSQEYLDQKKAEIDARGETRGRKKKVEN